MRFLVLAAILFLGCPGLHSQPAVAQQTAPPAPPPLNTRVVIVTPLSEYRGIFLGVDTNGNTVTWFVRTASGTQPVRASLVTSWQPDAGPGNIDFRVHGSNTIGAKLAPEIARAFAEARGLTYTGTTFGRTPEDFDVAYSGSGGAQTYVFRFEAHGSTTAFQDFLAEATDIGMASRRVTDNEVGLLRPKVGNLKAPGAENVIALDGLAVIVNQNNPILALSLDQISRIFSGDIQDWAQVSGAPGAINVYARDSRSGTFDTFRTLVLDPPPGRRLTASAKLFDSSEELSKSIAADPHGIGFVGLASVGGAKAVGISTTCGLHFSPEPFLVKSEEYPLSRRLFFYIPETRRSPQVDEFITFALSARVQPIISTVGFIPLNIEEAPTDYTLQRDKFRDPQGAPASPSAPRVARQFSQTIAGAKRLSVTFRFNSGSTDLDNRAIEDVGRLAAYISANPGIDRRVMLLGFADARGSFDRNVELSRERAAHVAHELSRRYHITLPPGQINAFSWVSPVACNESDLDLEKNRRVEVWLRR
jgi:phosphate transport system substrate-binding protein